MRSIAGLEPLNDLREELESSESPDLLLTIFFFSFLRQTGSVTTGVSYSVEYVSEMGVQSTLFIEL